MHIVCLDNTIELVDSVIRKVAHSMVVKLVDICASLLGLWPRSLSGPVARVASDLPDQDPCSNALLHRYIMSGQISTPSADPLLIESRNPLPYVLCPMV